MLPYALWRWKSGKWSFIRGLSTNKITHCSRFEKVVFIGCNPNNRPELFENPA